MADAYADFNAIGGAGSDGFFSTLLDTTGKAIANTVALFPAYVSTQLASRVNDPLYRPLGQWPTATTSQPKSLFVSGRQTIIPGVDNNVVFLGIAAIGAFFLLRK